MQLERNELVNLSGIFVRNGFVEEMIQYSAPFFIFKVLAKRNEINRFLENDGLFKDMNEEYCESIANNKNIIKELENVDSNVLKKYAFYLLNNSNETAGRYSESSNSAINNLIINLLNIESGDVVFDLGSNKGSFLVSAYNYCEEKNIKYKDLFGLEKNESNALISKVNLAIAGANTSWIETRDFISGVSPIYNKGTVLPPFGLKIFDFDKIKSQMFDCVFSPRNTFDWVFVDRLLKGLIGTNKRAVAIVSPRCMFNDADKDYRNRLVENGLIEAIIELPAGSLQYCSLRPVVVVFSEGNKGAKVVDATSLADKTIGKFSRFELDYKKVLELLDNADFVDNKLLLEAHSLSASSLLATKGEVFTGTPLCELADIFTGSQYTIKNFESMFSEKPTGYRILTSSDINDGLVEWNRLQSIDYKDTKFDRFAIQQNDIVITAKSSRVKTVVVDILPQEKILVTGGMIIVRPNIKKLNPTYLKIYLDSDKGKAALKAIQRGTTIIAINAKDVANILVPDASIEKQNDISMKYNNKLSTYFALKEELAKVENQLHSFDLDDLRNE